MNIYPQFSYIRTPLGPEHVHTQCGGFSPKGDFIFTLDGNCNIYAIHYDTKVAQKNYLTIEHFCYIYCFFGCQRVVGPFSLHGGAGSTSNAALPCPFSPKDVSLGLLNDEYESFYTKSLRIFWSRIVVIVVNCTDKAIRKVSFSLGGLKTKMQYSVYPFLEHEFAADSLAKFVDVVGRSHFSSCLVSPNGLTILGGKHGCRYVYKRYTSHVNIIWVYLIFSRVDCRMPVNR